MGTHISVSKLDGIFIALLSLPTKLPACFPTFMPAGGTEQSDRASQQVRVQQGCDQAPLRHMLQMQSSAPGKTVILENPQARALPALHTQCSYQKEIKSMVTLSILSGPRVWVAAFPWKGQKWEEDTWDEAPFIITAFSALFLEA